MKTTIAHVDQVKFPPTRVGPHGAAWLCDLAALARAGVPINATVGLWTVFSPGSHPFWPYVVISLIQLRPMEGLPNARIAAMGATHELFVAALDSAVTPDTENPHLSNMLRPFNYVGQFSTQETNPVDQDRAAAERVWAAVDEILAGHLNPDTDGRAGWIQRFGNSNAL